MNVPPGTPQPTPGIDTPEPHARSAGAERPRVPHGPGGAPDATLPELFEEAARRSPGAVALAGPAGEVTYGELDRRSAELARRLRARGVRPETRVGVCMGRTPELVAALLAVLRAGGAYVPLDPGYPRERLRFMLADSGAALLLADPAAAERLVDCGVEVMVPNGGAGYEAGSAQQDASSEDAPLPHSRTPALSHPSSLAYVVYTSGSTGTPKGVLGTHRGIVNRLAWMWSEHPFAAGEVCCQKTSLAFVDSVWEVFGPLLAGVPSVLVPDDEARDPEALAAILARHGVTRVVLVPSLLRALLDRHPELGERCPRLRLVVSSGEELPPGLARRFAEAAPGATLLNLYGSSEVAADCTAHALPPGGPDPGERVPIGRPIRNTRVHVAGAELEPVPEGAAGELCVAGAGLARGYMGNPAATAEAFVPDPFGGAPGERMYRTGDRGRRLPDGTLEFLGREDHQVKVRGVRVELREVEAALRGHAGVADAVVVARGGAGGDAALVAYVVPAAPGGEAAPADAAGGRTEEWTALWDDTYRAADADGEPALNVAGWMSSYTREPIPREEMREWVDRTVERILALRPERVLEVGFGTGMLLFRVAPRVRAYHGTELSPAALEYVGQRLDGLPGVRLSLRGADRLDGLAAEGFDTVVVNCVVQYFPGVDYLLRVLEGAAACLRPGGRIFVGDVRSLPLLEAYHASVELFRAPGDLPARTLRARVRRAVAEEKELVVDPALFHALRERIPRLGRVEVLAKRSVHDNEVVRYRCDVVLHLDGEGEPAAAPCRAWGDEVPDPDALRRLLAASPREPLAVLGIPDARLARDFRALELLARDDGPATAGELRAALAGPAGAGVDPEALWRLGESLGREVEVRPGEGGRCDALFHPAGGAGARAALPRPAAAARPPRELASDPGWERRAHALVPALRASLRERLPEPMVPASFVVLDALPLTPSGKTDRLALPAPDPARAGPGRERVPPRTEVERRIAAIWEEVLGVEAVGVRDGFLELGGHSLLGTRVTMRLREALGVELPLRALFEAPTVEQLARRVEAGRGGGAAVPAPLERAPRDAPLPLSFGQQRLWFLHRMQPLSPFYNESTAARLRGPLDARALRRALGEIVRRHEALRTVFPTAGDEPVQVVLPPSPLPLPVDDLSGLPGAERDVELRRRLREAAAAPFDLARGPLLRCRLFRLAGDEHVLSATLHHAVTDQWSLRVFFAELGALYRAPSGRPRPPLAPLPAQYADYAVWQRKRMRGPEMERQLAYWRARLAGAPPLLELPADRPRPSVQSHRGSRVSATLPRPLADALGELARREGATRYMLLLAAFGVLLARHAGQDDVVVGTPAAGRVRPELEGNIGFFVNSLALRMELGGSPGFRELLARVRRAVLDAHDHQELPFERLVEELRVERSPGYAPLFQVMFVLREGPLAELEIPGVAADVEEVPLGTAKFDLTLAVEERGGRLVVEAEYAADLFDRATAERMLERFRVLLEGIAARPEGRVAELPLLPEAERRVLEAWNDTAREYPADALVHRLFEAQARRTPGAPALLWRGETLDYAELDRRADRLAHLLRARGTGPESRVGVYLERTPAMVVALLAVLKAGGAYVPLDPAYPRERLGYMLEDAGVRVVLTTGALAGRLPAGAAEPLLLDAAPEPGPGSGDASPESGVGPENLSHVIFTSGSTGRPKGVMIRHRSTSVLVHWMREVVSDEERASVLFSTSISFDVSVAEVLGTLCWGGRLVMVENALELPSVAGEGIRYASMVPTAAAELLRTGGFPPSVRTLFLGGEPLPPDLARGLYALGHVRRVGNLYGPTEDTTYSTFALVAEGGAWVDVGRPVADTRARVLDGELQPAPVGVPGELYLAGAGLARGYAGRPDLTAARFLPDPFGGPGERMYRVMDRVRWLPDGTLEYLGRTDTQVKVRGFRIEPGEIEAVLRRHPGVRDAVAVAREDVPSERRLVAYVVPAGAEAPPAAELRAALREALPEYMVPSAIQPLDELPLTPSGKVDRRALPAPGVRPEGAAAGYEAPRTAGEARLARVWEEVLGTGPVGIHDDFFALGGHSLLATRVASRVRALLGIELPLHAVFEAPTLAALAARLDREAEDAAGTGAGDPPLLPRADDGPAPLSFAQERLWFLDRMDPGSAVYNVPVAFRVRGAADAGLLARAVSEVVRRHAVLRSGFAGGSGGPVQTVRPPAPVPLPVVDLAAAAGGRAEAELRRLLREEAARPFDLEAGPLLRTRFFRVAPGEAVLSLTVHHIASDGWSMGILFRELEEVHAALREGRAPALPELPVQYADFAAWQREWLRGERIERQAAYWRERLAGAAVLDLPTDHPRPAVKSYRGGELFFALDAPLAEGVAALAREEGATPYMLLLAAFQLLLSRYAGEDDVVVGTPIAGRTRRETEELIGFFVNTLAIRTRLGGGPTFRELLARVREATLEAYAHQDLPFEKLVEELGVERDLGRSPLFPVMFALQNAPAGGPRLAGAALEPVAVESTTAKFDLTLALAESGRGMDGSLEYAADLFERETVARLAEHFRVLLEGAVARPRAVAAGLPLLGPAERALLEGWSRAGAEAAPRLCVHELFAGQAARTPEAPALVHGGEVLAYGELDRRANRLARHLLRRGVRPGDRVGICLERSPEMVVGLLGILKAGAAYVPLDPGYPADRLAFLLADSAVPLLLTREGLLDRLGEHGAMAVCVDRDRAAIGREGADAPEVRVTPEHLAYVVYTSGSTGEPKGTEVPHRAVPGFFWDVDYVRFDERQVLLQHSSTSWDALTLELWPALLKGGRCVLYPERISEPLGLGEQVRAHGVTTLWISSAYFNLVVDTHPEALAGVRQLMVGGEAVSAPHLRRALELHPGLRLVNGYGPSECTVFASCWPVPPDFAGAAVPIGRPVGDRRVHVLDARSEPVPVGVPGELCVGGDGVGRGYLGRPALTAEKFVPDPFAAAPGVRLYRTGDRARWRADGTLEFLGRTDQQVKLRGFRIEPGEIEAALEAHPAVREAVVLLREDAPGERRLVGYVVGEPGAVPTAAELRTHLRERLPEHLVPAAIVALERLPLTPHGKTDRASLPAPELAAPAAAHVAPRTPTEELLAGIWADVLRRERVGVGESFFELGGHSLLATRVVSRIREAFGVELPLRALFEAPTLERLAARVEAQRAGGPGTAAPPLVPVERAGRLPLSFAQERLWFLEQLSPGGHVYTVPGVLRLEGPLDAGALEAALGEIVRRHEALRTRFPSDGGHPWQEVLPPGSPDAFRLRVEPVAAAEAEGRIRAEVERPFDLERGPLFRAALLRPGADEHVLVLSMHHVVCDGWSLGVLFREWSALYAAYARREASPLEEPAVQYGDYAVWQRAWLHGEALEAQLAYWRGRLAGAPALELPTDHPRPAVQGFAGARHSLTLGADETEGLRRLARREGATLFMVLMGGLQVLLGRYAESEDVVVGSPIAGRTRRETEGLIGLFVNTLALRTDLSGDPAFREVVGRVREGALGAYAHQEVPFERLVEELKVERDLSRSPLVQV
ncbi:MAG TPA: amino acid adenylation domain-containing protein, partial [Longimicrobiaceae bacterium]